MSQPPASAELLAAVAAVMKSWGDQWFVCGAQAVIVHGSPRMTNDVDITLRLVPDDPLGFASAMKGAGFSIRVPDLGAFVQRTRVIPLLHDPSGMPLDVILSGPGPEEEFYARAQKTDIGGVVVPVVSAEDLVVMKVFAGRVRDLDDVRGIVKRRAKALDAARIRRLLSEIEKALDRVDLVPVFDSIRAESNRP